jgi:hypothetical protein
MTAGRIIGLVLIVAAIMFGAADLWHTQVPYSGGSDAITMGRLWVMVSLASMNMVEGLIHQYLWAPIWDIGISALLLVPAWTFFGALGALFIVFGNPKASDQG